MRPRHSLSESGRVAELVDRMARLEPASQRRWGSLTAPEMLCHLADAFRATLGERPYALVDTWQQRTLIKWIALYTSLPWPKGVPTRPELDPHRSGSRPQSFDGDRAIVVELLRRFASPDARYGRHPAFGPLTHREWLLWGYGHVDHHLRQFGV